MPEYYKMLYPDLDQTDSSRGETSGETTSNKSTKPADDVVLINENIVEDYSSFNIETNLYKATVNSKNGGSFTFFELNNYPLNDSSLVNLINNKNAENLEVSFRSMDGDKINLTSGWKTENKFDVGVFTSPKKIDYYKTINNKRITKSLTFYPNKYVIDIEIDLSGANDLISQNSASLYWPNGLPLTEPNKQDELTYYSAVIYQGDEKYAPKTKDVGQQKVERMLYPTDWAGVRTKYFFTAFIPTERAPGAEVLAIENGEEVTIEYIDLD